MDHVIDNPAEQQFELKVGDFRAYIRYERKKGELHLLHTKVPDVLAGQGIGSRLARESLEMIHDRGEKIQVQCTFIQSFIKRNPDYKDVLKIR